jgi:uncharacterized protein DUF6894
MPYFYFHLKYSGCLSRDDEGLECLTLSVAKREAQVTARDMLVGAIKFSHERVPDALVIADANGRTLHTLPLAAVLPPRRG